LPLGRKFHALLGWINGTSGLVSVPFGAGRLAHPASWTKAVATLLVAGEHLLPEFGLIAPILRSLKKGTVVDVGANIGYFPLLIRRETALPILGFEPQPFLHELAATSVTDSGLKDVELRRLACGDAPGEVLFQSGPNGNIVSAEEAAAAAAAPTASSESPSGNLDHAAETTLKRRPIIPVPVVTLDTELAKTTVSLMKIDCEGYELKILQGAREVLRRDRPVLLIEVHPQFLPQFGGSVRQVVDFLSPMYDLEAWDFSPDRGSLGLFRSLTRYAPDRGRRFPDMETMITAAATPPLPTQLYLLGRPKA
jgi:FkbM family methyltransferase